MAAYDAAVRQSKSPILHLSTLRRSQPPDHLATLFMLGAVPEHLPPPMLPVSSGGDHGPATSDGGSSGGGDNGGGGDDVPLRSELRLGGAWRDRRRHFSFRYNRMEWHMYTACTPHMAPHAHCTHTHRMHVRTCRYNLMEHVGAVSTLRDEPHPESLPRCNDFLGVSASFKSMCRSCRRQTLSACLGLPFGPEGRA